MNNTAEKSIREAFYKSRHNDWALPGLTGQVQENARRHRPAVRFDMSVAMIGSARLEAALGDILRLTSLAFSEWRAQIEQSRPAFILIEADWLEASNPWRNALLNARSDPIIKELVEFCRAQNIPTVFWFNCDAPHIDAFADVFGLFDHVVTGSYVVEAVSRVRADAASIGVYVDTGCFNPYRHKAGRWDGLGDVAPYLMARAYNYMNARQQGELGEQIGSLFDYPFWIYEDRFDIRNNNQRLNPVERCRVLGCFQNEQRASLLKTAIAEILPQEIFPDRSLQVAQHILECYATKTLCVSDSGNWFDLLGGAIFQAEGADGFASALEAIEMHPLEAAIKAHHGWRHVMTTATYYELVEDICNVVGVPARYEMPKEAKLSFILPTIRPELVPMSVALYKAQNYENKELLIVLNADGLDVSGIKAAIEGDDTIQLLQTPSDMPVGKAVNLGVLNMTGDYWMKMDDDDYYSPNYLSDVNLNRKSIDFDIAGKGALFNYLEADDRTIARSWGLADLECHYFAGGTLVVKNTPDNVHWPENVRGYADIEFLTKRLVEGAHIASLDPFSHIQIRRSDSRLHTWTSRAVDAYSVYESKGLNIDSVFI